MINTVIFDFDNTIYDYDKSNNKALEYLFNSISSDFNIDINIIKKLYYEINKNIKSSNNSSNKFNKIIYIKQLFESLNINLINIDKYLNIYNTHFDNNLELYEEVLEIIILFKEHNIKIGLLSNNIFEQQYKKLKKLNILQYFDAIQTSDECGEEKPNINMFLSILNKLNVMPQNTIFIGDNLEHDIIPSLKLGILPFYFKYDLNSNIILEDKYIIFNDYIKLHIFFKKYFETVDELLFLSKYFGQSNLNVQGPGGNISVKLDDIIFIKSSGAVLGNMSYNEGYCLANNIKVKELLETKKDLELKETKIFGYKIPSMETFFHSFMEKYTVHIHFTLSNIFFCKNNIPILEDFPYKYEIIPYIPPGLLLSENIKDVYNKDTNIYFLKNHGIIITNNDYNKIIEIYENIYKYFNKLLDNKFNDEFITFNMNAQFYSKYKLSSIIKYINYPVDILLNIKYCFPDLAIFIEEICINNLDNITKKTNIIINDNKVYLIANTLNKIYYIIELLDKYKILCDYSYNNLLCINDTKYLQNMEQEKFRKL